MTGCIIVTCWTSLVGLRLATYRGQVSIFLLALLVRGTVCYAVLPHEKVLRQFEFDSRMYIELAQGLKQSGGNDPMSDQRETEVADCCQEAGADVNAAGVDPVGQG